MPPDGNSQPRIPTGTEEPSPIAHPHGFRRTTRTAAAKPRNAAATGLVNAVRTASTAAGTRRGNTASAASANTAPRAKVVRPLTTSATQNTAPEYAPAVGCGVL